MATIPVQATGLRHVRKTIAFDGTAGNGAVGTVDVFTITGRVHVERASLFATEALVDAGGGTPATLDFGVTGAVSIFTGGDLANPADGVGANQWVGFWSTGSTGGVSPISNDGAGWDISANVILTIANEAITDGTLVIDMWYYPITDDGALVAA